MNLEYFAGFVCDYRFSELYVRYAASWGIVVSVAVLLYVFGVKRVTNAALKRVLLVSLIAVAIVGAHLLYLIMISGGWLGCGMFPWLANPNGNV